MHAQTPVLLGDHCVPMVGCAWGVVVGPSGSSVVGLNRLLSYPIRAPNKLHTSWDKHLSNQSAYRAMLRDNGWTVDWRLWGGHVVPGAWWVPHGTPTHARMCTEWAMAPGTYTMLCRGACPRLLGGRWGGVWSGWGTYDP